jgi:hypothetical protein
VSRGFPELVWGPAWKRLLAGDALVVAALAVSLWAVLGPGEARGRAAVAEVTVNGRPALTVDLARDGSSEVRGPLGVTRLEVRGARIRVVSSPCPRQICRHGGWIGRPGETIVCLPNRVVVRIPGELPGAPDALAR